MEKSKLKICHVSYVDENKCFKRKNNLNSLKYNDFNNVLTIISNLRIEADFEWQSQHEKVYFGYFY